MSGIQIDRFPRNVVPFQLVAISLQIPKPLQFSLNAVPVQAVCADAVFFLVPVLVQEPYKKLLHGHLPDTVHVQVRQDAGDIIQQNPVAPHDIEIIRSEAFRIIVQDKGNPVHGHSGLSGTCHTLNDDIVIGRFADDDILLLLYGGHDFTEHSLLIFGQIFGQQIVIGHHLAVKILQELSGFDLIGALSFQVNGDLFIAGSRVAAFA